MDPLNVYIAARDRHGLSKAISATFPLDDGKCSRHR